MADLAFTWNGDKLENDALNAAMNTMNSQRGGKMSSAITPVETGPSYAIHTPHSSTRAPMNCWCSASADYALYVEQNARFMMVITRSPRPSPQAPRRGNVDVVGAAGSAAFDVGEGTQRLHPSPLTGHTDAIEGNSRSTQRCRSSTIWAEYKARVKATLPRWPGSAIRSRRPKSWTAFTYAILIKRAGPPEDYEERARPPRGRDAGAGRRSTRPTRCGPISTAGSARTATAWSIATVPARQVCSSTPWSTCPACCRGAAGDGYSSSRATSSVPDGECVSPSLLGLPSRPGRAYPARGGAQG